MDNRDSSDNQRQVRTYVLRQGRLTRGQEKALEDHWPVFGLTTSQGMIDPCEVFGNDHPVVFEIGFGMGDSLVIQAADNPDTNYLGTEVHRPGVGHLLLQTAEQSLSNLRVFNEDGLEVLTRSIADASLAGIQLFFPDPWHKKRHHKRRIINSALLDLAETKLVSKGWLHVATDWVPYAEEIEALFRNDARFAGMAPPDRPETKFERRGIRLGHEVRDLACQLIK